MIYEVRQTNGENTVFPWSVVGSDGTTYARTLYREMAERIAHAFNQEDGIE